MRRSVLMNLALLCVKADIALEQAKLRSALRHARAELGHYSPHLLRDMGLDETSLGRDLAARQRESLRLVCRSRQRHRWPRQS
ncbi:hypothetical protein ACFOSS_00125 [Pseudaeromonas sharmana]|uniref:DUF1127 domain-containing protein n=1 Tax=Pseudaeromonas sharmana TaxID=328412 RepID=A0ABV8CI26_9GAMM